MGLGAAAFLLLAAAACFTPARVPLLQRMGREYPALQLRLQALRLEAEMLRPRGSGVSATSPDFVSRDQVPALERAQAAVADAEARITSWRRANAQMTAFGFLGWLSDLWPWLLGLGFALPVLGGLIGAQAGRSGAPDPVGVHPAALPEPAIHATGRTAAGLETRAIHASTGSATGRDMGVTVGSPLQAPVAPAFGADTAPMDPPVLPPDPAAWNWTARPAPRAESARPKPPPVKSPHGNEMKNEE
jgi:hypothetical protein